MDKKVVKHFNITILLFFLSLILLVFLRCIYESKLISDFFFYAYLILSYLFIISVLYQIRVRQKVTLFNLSICFLLTFTFIRTPGLFGNMIFLSILTYFVTMAILLSIEKTNTWILCAIIWVSFFIALQSVLGLLQKFHFVGNTNGLFDIIGTFNNPNLLGNVLAIGIAFLFPLAGYWKRISGTVSLRLLILSVLLLACFTVIATVSRSSWIAIIGSLTFTYGAIFFSNKSMTSRLLIFLLPLSIVILIVGKLLLFNLNPAKADSVKGRYFIYKTMLSAGFKRPIIGHGFGSFARDYNIYQANYFLKNPKNDEAFYADNINTAPSSILQLFFEFGLIGMFFFILPFILLLRNTWLSLKIKQNDGIPYSLETSCIAVLTCYLILCLFSYPVYILELNLVVLFSVTLTKPYFNSYNFFRISFFEKSYRKMSQKGILIFFIFALSISLRKYYFLLKWKDLQIQNVRLTFEDRSKIERYQELHPYLKDEYFFLLELGILLFENKKFGESLDVFKECNNLFTSSQVYIYVGRCYQELKRYSDAERAFIIASSIVPNRIHPKFYLLNLYCDIGAKEKTERVGKEILQQPIKVDNKLARLIREKTKLILEENNFQSKLK